MKVLATLYLLIWELQSQGVEAALRGGSRREDAHLETVVIPQQHDSFFTNVTSARIQDRRLQQNSNYFQLLSCNEELKTKPCAPWSSLHGLGMTKENLVVIPCGTCLYLDLPGETLTLEEGIDIRGRLEIRNGYRIQIVTPMIVVQGHLWVWATWKIRDGPMVRFTLQGNRDNYFTPINENSNACGGGQCQAGARSITVAGGDVSLRGIFTKVPTMAKLYDVDSETSIILPDPDGYMQHWGVGAEIVIATSSHLHDHHQVRTITKVHPASKSGFIRMELNEAIRKETTTRESLHFATEVALLTRNIRFESPEGSGGGHFRVLNTPFINQEVRGVDIVNFGQAGLLGRYPLHFHMCGDSSGSVVRKNTIRHSNQRGIVVHGTNNLKIEDNVSFDVKGHTYVIEDGIETGNEFIRNIAIYTRNQNVIIPPSRTELNGAETDAQAAAFWITNANNNFVENIAAGAQTNGFWLELQKRGTRASEFSDMEPIKVPLGLFEGNVVHSVPATGIRLYLNGYQPDSMQIMKGLKVYRCFYGIRVHRVHSLEFHGAMFADNSYSVFVDLSANIRFTASLFLGYSAAYKMYVDRFNFARTPCGREQNENVGLSFTRDNPWDGSPFNGLIFNHVKFDRFDELPCGEKSALRLVNQPSNYRTFDMTGRFRGVDVETEMIDMCPGVNGGVTDVYLSDDSGSFAGNGVPSTVLVNTSEMRKFIDQSRCTTNTARCHMTCSNTCFRTVFYMISSRDTGKWRLKVCDRNDLSNCHVLDEHTNRFRFRYRFAVHVPSGKQYDAVFVDKISGQEVYPDDVDVEYQDKLCSTAPDNEDIHLLDIPRGETHSPTASPTTFDFRCENTVKNSDMEIGTRDWSVVGLGGISTTLGYRSETALKYFGANRHRPEVARIQTTLDIGECFQPGTTWEFTARLKLTDSATGQSLSCDTSSDGIACPKILLTLRDFNHNLFYARITGFESSYDWNPQQFNLFRGYWTVGQGEPLWDGRARTVRVGFLDFDTDIDLALDDFEVTQVAPLRSLEPESPPSRSMNSLAPSDSCYGDIDNADLQHGHEGHWEVIGSGVLTNAAGPSGLAIQYKGANRTGLWEGPAYDLGRLAADDCMGQGSTWEITAQLRLIDASTGEGVFCDPYSSVRSITCPKLILELNDMLKNVDRRKLSGLFEWDANGFNIFKAYYTLQTESDVWTNIAKSGKIRVVDFPLGVDLIIDDFSVTRID